MTARLAADDVRKIAKLARLRLGDDEAAQFAAQFEGVLELMARVRDVPVEGTAPLLHPLGISDVLRDDVLRDDVLRDDVLRDDVLRDDVLQSDVLRTGLTHADALGGAPDTEDGLFRVPRVLPAGDE